MKSLSLIFCTELISGNNKYAPKANASIVHLDIELLLLEVDSTSTTVEQYQFLHHPYHGSFQRSEKMQKRL